MAVPKQEQREEDSCGVFPNGLHDASPDYRFLLARPLKPTMIS
jgi:hypothetical protein